MSTSSLNDEFIFECDQHAVNIYEKLQKLYGERDLFDITLIAGDDCIKVPAHKIVLSALSEYFSDIFHGSSTVPRANDNEFALKEIDSSTLTLILDYMYSGSIELNLEIIETLLRSAVFLKMKNLVDGCCDYLEQNLNISNCLNWLCLAKELKVSGLQDKSWNFIYNHFEEVTKQSEFLHLNKVELKDLLFTDNPHGHLEEQVFLSLVTWLEYEESNRQDLLLELLSMVRYQYLTPKFIVENSSSVSRTFESWNLILHWLKYHLSPESRTIEQQNLASSSKSDPRREVSLQKESGENAVIRFNDQNEAEILSYNQTLETWSIRKRSLALSIKERHSSKIVIDEQIFLVGGATNAKHIQCIDLKTFTLTDLPPMQIGRYASQLANLNGHLCTFGGFEDDWCKKFNDSVEIFNFSTRKWSTLEPPFKPDQRHKIVGHNGILYIFDFRYGSLQCYDVTSNQWTSKELPIDDSIEELRMAGVGNFVYAFCTGPSLKRYKLPGSYRKTVVKCLELSNNTWSDVSELIGDFCIKMVTVIGNKLLIHKTGDNMVEYNLVTNTFTELSNVILHFGCILPFKI